MPTQTVNNIIEAATALFARRGPEGVTVLDIARQCQVSPGTIIYHFKSKENLLFIISRSIFIKLNNTAKEATLGADTHLDFIHAFIDAFFSFAQQNHDDVLFLARFDPFTRLDLDHFPNADLLMLQDQYLGLLEQCVESGLAAGSFNPVNSRVLRSLTWATFLGVCHKYCQQTFPLQDLCQEYKRMATLRLTGSLGDGSLSPRG